MSTIKDGKTQGQTISVECPECKVNTKHTVERSLDWSGSSEDGDIQAWGTYQIVRCNGCDTLSFRSVHRDSEDWTSDEYGNIDLVETENLYPERPNRSPNRLLTEDLYLRSEVYKLPQIIQTIYRETLTAVQHDLSILAGIGIRSIIEATCTHLGAKDDALEKESNKRSDDLNKKINKLKDMSMLTSGGAKTLHGIRLLGNAAAHEVEAPTAEQIKAAFKVIDHLLLGAFVIQEEASILPKPESQPTNNTANGEAKGKHKPCGKGDE